LAATALMLGPVAPMDGSFRAVSVPALGDQTAAAQSDQHFTLSIVSRIKNVVLFVDYTGIDFTSSADSSEALLRKMIDRVNAQAR
jgi:hypothetical protein